MAKKLLMFGDRHWNDERTIRAVFDRLPEDDYVIIHGAATGADAYCGLVAEGRGFDVRAYPAEWEKHKQLGRLRAAGPIRNRQMLSENPDIDACIGFHNNIDASKGSKNMRDEAEKQGFKVQIIQSLWPVIDTFRGEFAFLSNFYACELEWEGQRWPTLEHAYQAAKTFDVKERTFVRTAGSASEAKRRGGQITMRHDWDSVKMEVMYELVKLKFSKPPLHDMLLATNDATLVEGNVWGDVYWGVCRGIGMNRLGKVLMKVRDCLNSASTSNDVVLSDL